MRGRAPRRLRPRGCVHARARGDRGGAADLARSSSGASTASASSPPTSPPSSATTRDALPARRRRDRRGAARVDLGRRPRRRGPRARAARGRLGSSSRRGGTATTTSCRRRSTSSRGRSRDTLMGRLHAGRHDRARGARDSTGAELDEIERVVLDGLRLGLLRLPERPDRHRALGRDAGRGRDRERVPLPGRRLGRAHPRRGRQPVGRDRRHLPRPARGATRAGRGPSR